MQFDQLKRREFITLLGAAAAWPLAAGAQQSDRVRRIGVLTSNAEGDPEAVARVRALEQGLQKLGLAKGRNIVIDYHWGVSDPARIRSSVQEAIELNPDVLLSHTPSTTVALQQATRTIPIVFVQGADPIHLGLVASLSRPGGNVTGFVSSSRPSGASGSSCCATLRPKSRRHSSSTSRKTHLPRVSSNRSRTWRLHSA